jgi:molecular chaperone GrpE
LDKEKKQQETDDRMNRPPLDEENGENEAAADSPAGEEQPPRSAAANQAEALAKELEETKSRLEEYKDSLRRLAAEYDNYKKRTLKERQILLTDVKAMVVASVLPLIDNFERARSFSGEPGPGVRDGLDMILKQTGEILSNLGVEEIPAQNAPFDPDFHNAAVHVEKEGAPENTVVEVLQKGYTVDGRVIRHSVVKVAN